jgi:hypothetical protein
MKIYLDNCTFNRPFDDQSSMRVKLEAEAKLFIQERIMLGKLQLIWSYILEYENIQNPFIERRNAIIEWKKIATRKISESENIVPRAMEYMRLGVKAKDALRIASAIEGKAEYLLTTDDMLLNKLVVINPVNFIPILEEA